ncbi:hypothetical protein GEMRC1_012333 [Eukaryota sp. GEM-RC1]
MSGDGNRSARPQRGAMSIRVSKLEVIKSNEFEKSFNSTVCLQFLWKCSDLKPGHITPCMSKEQRQSPISPSRPYVHSTGQPVPGSPPMTFSSPKASLSKSDSGSPTSEPMAAPVPVLPSTKKLRAITPLERSESGRLASHFLLSPTRKKENVIEGSFIRPMPEELSSMSVAEILSLEKDAEHSPKARMGLLWRLVSAYIPTDPGTILRHVASHLEFSLARSRFSYNPEALFLATAYSVRDRLIQFWNDTSQFFNASNCKRAYYLSIEFLMGRQMLNALVNLDILAEYRSALLQLGFPLERLCEEEKDAALGNGGLGRLAACMLDSAATLDMPVWGYGLKYSYGMFKQNLVRGYQYELPDFWLTSDMAWVIERTDVQYEVMFYGSVSGLDSENRATWTGGQIILACAHDFPIPGFGTYNCTNIRLWSSRPAKEFDLEAFNTGEYYKIVEQRQDAENLTSVLYPDDSSEPGRVLRLKQQYFFVAASLADIVRRFKKMVGPALNWECFPDLNTLQLNDTHPSLAIPELLRILMDVERLTFKQAFSIVKRSYNYTCHTLLPEALEKWPMATFAHLLPRHLQLILLINHHHLEHCRKTLGADHPAISELSLIEEDPSKMIRMANLCVIGSTHVNGVARMHGALMKKHVFKNFTLLNPDQFMYITNGFTQRRWLLQCNPNLAQVISDCLGSDRWMIKLEDLDQLRQFADEPDLHDLWSHAKFKAKKRFADWVSRDLGIDIDPNRFMFDVMVKRIHEYKRQLMNVLSVICYYLQLRSMNEKEKQQITPRAVFIGGKAAPGYHRAKVCIKLITSVADVINKDARTKNFLKLVFVPNYCVSVAELIIPAADVSQHISTAGTEASGTSNMKFCLNGAILLGTRDGASVEISEEIGEDNIFFFGMTSDEVEEARERVAAGKPEVIDERLQRAVAAIQSNTFGPYEIFKDVIEDVKAGTDFYCVAGDFGAYVDARAQVSAAYKDKRSWLRKSILTCAGMSKFSSDRMLADYCEKIWNIKPCRLPDPVYSENSRLMVSSAVPKEIKALVSPSLLEKHTEAIPPYVKSQEGVGIQ